MNKEQKNEFTARIIKANRSELIVIMYDMMFVYMEDAIVDYNEGDWEKVKLDLIHIEDVLRRLENDLDHTYQIANELFVLYHFCLRAIAKCRIKKNLEGMEEARKVLKNLYVGMQGMSKQDDSKPMMMNSQKIVAGLTYGKNCVNEVYMDDEKRGFYA